MVCIANLATIDHSGGTDANVTVTARTAAPIRPEPPMVRAGSFFVNTVDNIDPHAVNWVYNDNEGEAEMNKTTDPAQAGRERIRVLQDEAATLSAAAEILEDLGLPTAVLEEAHENVSVQMDIAYAELKAALG